MAKTLKDKQQLVVNFWKYYYQNDKMRAGQAFYNFFSQNDKEELERLIRKYGDPWEDNIQHLQMYIIDYLDPK